LPADEQADFPAGRLLLHESSLDEAQADEGDSVLPTDSAGGQGLPVHGCEVVGQLLSDEVDDAVRTWMDAARQDPGFGNARTARWLLEAAIRRLALRADLDGKLVPGALSVADGAAIAYLVPPTEHADSDPRLAGFLAALGEA
jgi:hypothetical protein